MFYTAIEESYSFTLQTELRKLFKIIVEEAKTNPLSKRQYKSNLTDLDGKYLDETYNYNCLLTGNFYTNISMGANSYV